MRKNDETKAAPTRDQAWFERTVAERKAELEKLPADRQEELIRKLERGDDSVTEA